MKKKIISIILVAGMAVSLAACSNTEETKEVATETAAGSEADSETTEEEETAAGGEAAESEGADIAKGVDSADAADGTLHVSDENKAYVDDSNNLIIDIATNDDSYFDDNDIHVVEVETNAYNTTLGSTMETYGMINSPNDCRVKIECPMQINIIEDEEDGYVDTVFTVKITGANSFEFLGSEEDYNQYVKGKDPVPVTPYTSYAVFDYYTGSSLYLSRGWPTDDGEVDLGGATVILPDGDEGYVSIKALNTYDSNGDKVLALIAKHPEEYDGVVFSYNPSIGFSEDEYEEMYSRWDAGDVKDSVNYAEKTISNLDYEDEYCFYRARSNVADLKEYGISLPSTLEDVL